MSCEQHCIYSQDSSNLPNEFKLVLICSWLSDNIEQQDMQIKSLVTEDIDWENVLRLAVLHGTLGVFCSVMFRSGWPNVSNSIKEHFKRIRIGQAARALKHVAELRSICNEFRKEGIQLIPLKGVLLSFQLYGDSTVRNSVDIDILVKKDDFERAGKLLFDLGYQISPKYSYQSTSHRKHIHELLHHYEFLNPKTSCVVELHWRSYLWSESQISLLWNDSIETAWMGIKVSQLSQVDTVLFLAEHGSRHGWQCLKWLSDLSMLWQKISPNELSRVYERALSFELQRVMLHTELMLERFYGIKLSCQASSILKSNAKVGKLTDFITKRLVATSHKYYSREHIKVFKHIILLRILRPSVSIFTLLKIVAITPDDFVEVSLPKCLFWLYIPLRPILWFKRHFWIR